MLPYGMERKPDDSTRMEFAPWLSSVWGWLKHNFFGANAFLTQLTQRDLILIDHSKNLLRGNHGDVTAVRRGSHGEYFLPAVL